MRNLVLLFIASFIIQNKVHSQADLKVIVQSYVDQSAIESIDVILKNNKTSLEKSLSTNENGIVIFSGLPEGTDYLLYIPESQDQFEWSSTLNLRSNEDKTVHIDLLDKRTVNLEEVSVSARPVTRINRQDAEISYELSKKELLSIPVEGRDITRVLYRLPNVSQATGFYPEAPNVSINGANSLFTSYLIDGMDNNERFLGGQKFNIPVGFVQNITVLTNNFSAEYGNTANGVIDITTKSGGNEWEGEAFFITRPGPSIDGKSDFAQRDLSGNFVKDGFQRYQTGFSLSGPIIKDQTFFSLNAEHTTDLKDNLLNSPSLNVNETIRGNNYFTYLSGKIDHNFNSVIRSSLRINLGLVEIEQQGGGLEGGVTFPSAGFAQQRNSFIAAWKTSIVKNNFASQTNIQYSRFNWNYADPFFTNQPHVSIQDPSGQLAARIGSPDFTFDQIENTFQVQQKLSWYFGSHRLKAGLEIISSDHNLQGGSNPNGNYTVRLNESQIAALANQNLGSTLQPNDLPSDAEVILYNVELRPAEFGDRQTISSLYVEDQWTLSERTNLTLGLRYDHDNMSKGASRKGDQNNLGPRININHRLGRQSSLRFGYGIYYDKIPYAVHSDALQQNTTSADYRLQISELVRLGLLPSDTDIDAVLFNGNLSASLTDVGYLQGPSGQSLQERRENVFSNERRILSPFGYDNPYSHQFGMGYQLQLHDHALFFVDVMYNRSYDLLRLRNLNAAAPYRIDPENVVVRNTTDADLSRPIPIINGGAAEINGEQISGVARNVVITESEGESEYMALSVNYQKERGDDNYDLRINYTLSRLENNTEDINFRAMDGNDFSTEWGPSINDRTHIINAIYNYYPTSRLQFNLSTLIQSGQPINRIPDAQVYGTTDLNGDGASFGDAFVGNSDRHPGESRNNDRLPWANTFDVGLQYTWNIAGNDLIIRTDVFNIFNAQNLSGYSNNATQSNQIQAGSRASGLIQQRNASPPRQFQFGVRYLF